MRDPAAYGSGESLPGADVLQAESSNSRVLYTLDVKSRVIAFDESSLMLRAVGQLKSRAWRARPVHAAVEVEADPGSLVTSRSISGAATHQICSWKSPKSQDYLAPTSTAA